jgi:hypothetical protein
MAIQQGVTNSFTAELPQALHNFAVSGGDVFMLALYTGDASLGPTTTAYSTDNEVQGVGYVAGGKQLTISVGPTNGTSAVYWSFDNVVWDPAAFTARAGLIYNATNGNRSVCVLDFGADKTAALTFEVQMPPATDTASILRLLKGASL